ncbi:MAG: hypothetical protein ABSC63_10135 [Candidatus Binataceae bacterium]|jgi:hypothetical protein
MPHAAIDRVRGGDIYGRVAAMAYRFSLHEHLRGVLAAETSLVPEFSAHNSLDDAKFVNLFKLTRTSQIKKVK